jgi:Glycosyl hydrolase family 9/Cellulase N-terminal ig-like domain
LKWKFEKRIKYLILPSLTLIGFIILHYFEEMVRYDLTWGHVDTYGVGFSTWWLNSENFWGTFELNTIKALIISALYLTYIFESKIKKPGQSESEEKKTANFHSNFLKNYWACIPLLIILVIEIIFSGFSPGTGNEINGFEMLVSGWYPQFMPYHFLEVLMFLSGFWILPMLIKNRIKKRKFKRFSNYSLILICIALMLFTHLIFISTWELADMLYLNGVVINSAILIVFILPIVKFGIFRKKGNSIADNNDTEKDDMNRANKSDFKSFWNKNLVFWISLMLVAIVLIYILLFTPLLYFSIMPNLGIIAKSDYLPNYFMGWIYTAFASILFYQIGYHQMIKKNAKGENKSIQKEKENGNNFKNGNPNKPNHPNNPNNPNNAKKGLVIFIGLLIITSGVIFTTKVTEKDPVSILFNQIGYLPEDNKEFMVELPAPLGEKSLTFSLINQSNNPVVINREIIYLGELWGRYYASGNFTEIQAPGLYVITVNYEGKIYQTGQFNISKNTYQQVLERAVQFYYYERCGTHSNELIPGYVGHKACHLDDGIWIEEDGIQVWKDLSGGWHDAGDYGKYMEHPCNTQLATYVLAYTYEMNKQYFDNSVANLYDTAAPDVVDEAVWGAKFLQKMIALDNDGNARVYSGVYATFSDGSYDRFGYSGVPSDETDNIIGTGDERTVGSLWNVSGDESFKKHEYDYIYVNSGPALVVSAALAQTAIVQNDFTYWKNKTESPENLIKNASRLYKSHIESIIYPNQTVNPNSRGSYWCALLATETLARWYEEMGNNTEFILYKEKGDILHDAIINIGYLSSAKLGDSARNVNLHYDILANWRWEILINGTGAPSLNFLNVIGNWTASVFRPTVEEKGNYFNFLKHPTRYFHFWGGNWGTCTGAMASMICWNLTETTGYGVDREWMQDYAYQNGVHWIMGRNPEDICQIESLGHKNLPIYHNRYMQIPGNTRGAVPGAVPNGITNPKPNSVAARDYEYVDENDLLNQMPDYPWFDSRNGNPEERELGEFRNNELYITDNANFLLGFATIQSLSSYF